MLGWSCCICDTAGVSKINTIHWCVQIFCICNHKFVYITIMVDSKHIVLLYWEKFLHNTRLWQKPAIGGRYKYCQQTRQFDVTWFAPGQEFWEAPRVRSSNFHNSKLAICEIKTWTPADWVGMYDNEYDAKICISA